MPVTNRLDPRFADADNDLIADPPADPKRQVDPDVLVLLPDPDDAGGGNVGGSSGGEQPGRPSRSGSRWPTTWPGPSAGRYGWARRRLLGRGPPDNCRRCAAGPRTWPCSGPAPSRPR
jgi:hypothetical protein